ncbi:hypothetical protein GCM10027052_05120 [Parafrigoribacterium mesophilum]
MAVDGPAGSGKSSVSRAAARALGFDYQDSGAAYRAVAWNALEHGVDTENPDAVLASLEHFDYRIGIDPDRYFVSVGDTDITAAIRQPRVTAVVSHIARIPAVRERLVRLFREVIASSTRPGVITEGRDITTVVAPDAQLRVLLTASEESRVARRAAQHGRTIEAVGQKLSSRDAQDSKVVDFMNAADGVVTLDSTNLDFDATVSALVTLIRNSAPPPAE